MKNFNRYSLGMLPLLSILAMSPSVMETQFSGRGIASVEIEKIEIEKPKFEVEKFKADIKPLKVEIEEDDKIEIEREKIELPKQKIVVEKFKPEIQKLDVEIEGGIKKEKIELDAKIQVDDIKQDIQPIEIDTSSIVQKEEIKPDMKIVVDKIKPDIKPLKVADIKKNKIERRERREKDEVCEQDEKVKALTSQVEQLVASQNQIMQSMLNMSQMMMMQSMMMQQQMMMSQFNSMGTKTSPYEYASQTTAGNWVYYPSGFQPQQQNIFAQQGQQPLAQQGFYPDQAHAQPQAMQSSWNLQPGTFGMFNMNNVGFNMGSQGQAPVGMNQAQFPQLSQAQGMPTTGPIM